MKRITGWDKQGIVNYNLRDGGTAVTIFADASAERVNKTRQIVQSLINDFGRKVKIVEPGCSAGDISGYFAKDHEVIGYDISPAAVRLTRERYPDMIVEELNAEDIEPVECDILVLCEFIEHIDDPVAFVDRWFPKAKAVVVSHPLDDDGHEAGHVHSFTLEDFKGWFDRTGYSLDEYSQHPWYGTTVIGYGKKLEDSPESLLTSAG